MDKAKRFSHATKSLVEIARPNSVRIYNLHMGGVDLMDSLVAHYRHSQRNKRWYMRIFYHLMNVAVVNACLLWRKDGRETNDLLEFKSSIASALIYTGSSLIPKKKGRPSSSASPCTESTIKKRKLSNVSKELRFDNGKHYPKKSEGKFALKCKNESCKSKTRYICGRCNVNLCPECFEEFHENFFFLKCTLRCM
ncbi:hypothetical protein AVEN_98850-1 [Araneus ventricosus]|uniref:PiggyBac transposable element-derived protein domain-containing protein n=1 Tax=Araneus ventricosus TaxID=182803 RepID=A0A4Y2T8B5_ARAVE|nr:hypothetical protein AVEN_98850-1 [Araneus ventricosus]